MRKWSNRYSEKLGPFFFSSYFWNFQEIKRIRMCWSFYYFLFLRADKLTLSSIYLWAFSIHQNLPGKLYVSCININFSKQQEEKKFKWLVEFCFSAFLIVWSLKKGLLEASAWIKLKLYVTLNTQHMTHVNGGLSNWSLTWSCKIAPCVQF